MSVLLQISDLTVRFEASVAVLGLDLTVERGQIVGLVGESGSGKSTVALAVLGLAPSAAMVSAQDLSLSGESLLGLTPVERRRCLGRRIAFVPQEPMSALNPTLRIGTQLDMVLANRWAESREARRQRAIDHLAAMGLTNPQRLLKAYPHELSGGQLQRVLLAQAFALEPELIVADEPTTALDVSVQAEVLRLLETSARKANVGVLFISHDLAVVWRLCDQVVVMRQGRIVESGPTRDLLSAPSQDYTRQLLAALPSRSPPRTRLPVAGLA